MKRLLLLLGPVVALIGSLGLFMFGSAPVGVFDVLTLRIADPPEPPPPVLAELQWAVVSATALVIGLVISCVAMATVMRDSGWTISTMGRMMYIGASVLLIIAAVPLAWSIMGAKGSFRVIATSASPPTPESIRETIQYVEPTMTIGYATLILSGVLLLLAGSVGFQARPSQIDATRPTVSIVFALGSVLVGVVLLLLILSIRFNGNALGAMITDASVTLKPAELAAHLAGILNKSLFVFGGLVTLGLLQMLASIFVPSAGSNGGSDI